MNRLLLATGAVALLAVPAQAHRQWFMPSATVLAAGDQWVTVDAAVSNELFYPDHQPMRMEGVKVWAPDGSPAAHEHAMTGRYRSTFDVHLDKPGTWKIGSGMSGLFGSYKLNGEQKRWRGRPEELASAIPAGATDVNISENDNRNEVFVTAGEPTTAVFKPTGRGIELQPVTHPNDLVSDQPATFQFLVDGKPAANLKLALVPGGNRYRSETGETALATDADGKVTIKWPAPGMYWLSASLEGGTPSVPQAKTRRMSYTTTLEVLAP